MFTAAWMTLFRKQQSKVERNKAQRPITAEACEGLVVVSEYVGVVEHLSAADSAAAVP